MPDDEALSDEQRVLLYAPSGRDGALAARVLDHAGLRSCVCDSGEELAAALARGAGAAVLVEEALSSELVRTIADTLARQPPWSDLPLIIFTQRNVSSRENRKVHEILVELGNVTALERPIHSSTLVSAVRAALRARARQYNARAIFEEREREVRQRDQFLALLGHELRNPLCAIGSAVAVADLHAPKAPRLSHPLQVIERQVRHLTQLVDELLDVARVTTGKITLRPAPLDLRSIAEAQTEEIRDAARDHHVDVTLAQAETPVLVVGDAVRLAQVVSNLLTNAVKYTPPGGAVDVSVRREDEALLCVKDTGVGISEETLPDIFEPFTQAERTLDRAQGGMGLGLSVVRELVKLHGGNVSATSAGLGQGTEFVVRLPLFEPKAHPAARAEPERPSPSVARHILVIEDGTDNRELLTEFLAAQGHRVDAAANGEEGVQLGLEKRPEVALIDIGLPLVDGYEVARRLRAAFGAAIYLVALTGYGQPDDRARATAAGFDVHLTKPMNLDRLQEVLAPEANPAVLAGARHEAPREATERVN